MVYTELERGKKGRITGWEGIEKGPDVLESAEDEKDESSISESDIEYFKKNPKELSSLVADLVKLRGGNDAIKEGATWDKEMRAYVGADGLPRDWAHLTGYLKRNPDAIGKVLEEYNELQAADDEGSDFEAAMGGAEVVATEATTVETAAAEASSAQAEVDDGGEIVEEAASVEDNDETIDEASEEQKENVIDFAKAKEGEKAKKLSSTEAAAKISELDGRIDGITDYHEQSAVWESMAKVLDGCSDDIKAQVKYMRADEALKRDQAFLEDRKAKLKKMPLFTFPWSKRHQEKQSLKYVIASTTKSLEYQQNKLNDMAKTLPESISDEDRGVIDKFRGLDARMSRSNADLHVRGLAGDIRMREKWIRDQENSLKKTEAGTKAINDPGEKARREAIERWQKEIADLQAHIDEYTAEHPDFVMDPTKKPKSESLDKAA